MSRGLKSALLVLLLSTVGVLAAAPNDHQILGGVRVGPYEIGKDFEPMKKLLGEPDKVQESRNSNKTHLLFYNKRGLAFFVRGKTLNGITVFTRDFATREGIKVGMARADVLKVLGKSQDLRAQDVVYPELGLGFTFDAGKIAKIYVVDKEARDELKGDRSIVAGQRIGGVKLGMPLSAVTKVWGNPDNAAPLPGKPGHVILQYKQQIGIIVVVFGGKVEVVSAFSPEYSTPEGLHKGSSKEDVVKVFGSKSVDVNGIETYKERGIGFTIEDGKVTEISILQPAPAK